MTTQNRNFANGLAIEGTKEEPKPEYDQQALLDRIKELEYNYDLCLKSTESFSQENLRLSQENDKLHQKVIDLQESYDEQVEEIKKYRQTIEDLIEDLNEELSQARFESSQRLVEIVQLKETIASFNLLIRKANINDDDHTS